MSLESSEDTKMVLLSKSLFWNIRDVSLGKLKVSSLCDATKGWTFMYLLVPFLDMWKVQQTIGLRRRLKRYIFFVKIIGNFYFLSKKFLQQIWKRQNTDPLNYIYITSSWIAVCYSGLVPPTITSVTSSCLLMAEPGMATSGSGGFPLRCPACPTCAAPSCAILFPPTRLNRCHCPRGSCSSSHTGTSLTASRLAVHRKMMTGKNRPGGRKEEGTRKSKDKGKKKGRKKGRLTQCNTLFSVRIKCCIVNTFVIATMFVFRVKFSFMNCLTVTLHGCKDLVYYCTSRWCVPTNCSLAWLEYHILYLIYSVNNRCICISNICVCHWLHSPVYQWRELVLSEIILLNRIITVLHSFLKVLFFANWLWLFCGLFLHRRKFLARINLSRWLHPFHELVFQEPWGPASEFAVCFADVNHKAAG